MKKKKKKKKKEKKKKEKKSAVLSAFYRKISNYDMHINMIFYIY